MILCIKSKWTVFINVVLKKYNDCFHIKASQIPPPLKQLFFFDDVSAAVWVQLNIIIIIFLFNML